MSRKSESGDFLEQLIHRATRPRYYGKKYATTHDEESLMLALGEACGIDAFSLAETLQPPRRRRITLFLLRVLWRRKYLHDWFLFNFCFSHCLHFVAFRLIEALRDEFPPEELDRLAFGMIGAAAAALVHDCNFSNEESKLLRQELAKRIREYHPGAKTDAQSVLTNIMQGLGRKVTPRQFGEFIVLATMNPLRFAEPLQFAKRLKEIRAAK